MSTIQPPFVVTLYDTTGANRGPGTVKAVYTDAKDIGVSSYANQGGEMFFTLPWNHPQINQILPWQRHWKAERWNPNTSGYDTVGVGLLDDLVADENEVVAYGIDYLSMFDLAISQANSSANNTLIGTIISAQLSSAISASNSVSGFITVGTIDATTQTVTVLTSYQSRLQFIQQLIDIWQSDSSVRPILSVTRSSPYTISFNSNKGSDQTTRKFEYGGFVNAFQYDAGYTNFATYGYAIGQKRDGASILYSTQSYANPADFGRIERATVFLDIVNQAALDRKAKRFARRLGTPENAVAFNLRINQIGPWEWGEFADSIPISISRGVVDVGGTNNVLRGGLGRTDVDYALYTVWGQEWTSRNSGSEDLFLSVAPKEL